MFKTILPQFYATENIMFVICDNISDKKNTLNTSIKWGKKNILDMN